MAIDKLIKTDYNNRDGSPKTSQTESTNVGAWDMEQIAGKINESIDTINDSAGSVESLNDDIKLLNTGKNLSLSNPTIIYGLKNGVWVDSFVNPNLISFANSIDNAGWVKSDLAVGPNQSTAPDGSQTADSLVAGTNTVSHSFTQTVDANPERTQSIYVKYDGTTKFFQMYSGVTVDEYANFDIQLGTFIEQGGVNINPRIEDVGNGWFRIGVTLQMAGTCNYQPSNTGALPWAGTWAGNGSDRLFVWGAKVEVGDKITG